MVTRGRWERVCWLMAVTIVAGGAGDGLRCSGWHAAGGRARDGDRGNLLAGKTPGTCPALVAGLVPADPGWPRAGGAERGPGSFVAGGRRAEPGRSARAIRLDRCIGMAGVNGPACVLLAGPLSPAWSARGGNGWMSCGRCGGSGPTMTVTSLIGGGA